LRTRTNTDLKHGILVVSKSRQSFAHCITLPLFSGTLITLPPALLIVASPEIDAPTPMLDPVPSSNVQCPTSNTLNGSEMMTEL